MSGSKLVAPNSGLIIPKAVNIAYVATAQRGFNGKVSLLEVGSHISDCGRDTHPVSRTKRFLTIAIRDQRSEDWLRDSLRNITSESLRDFALVYYSVYRKVFRPEDFEDHGPTLDYLLDETLKRVTQYGYASFWCSAMAKDGTPVGLTTGGILPKSGTMFIGYLGVAEEYRRNGVDLALLAEAVIFSARACGLYEGKKSGSTMPKYGLGELEVGADKYSELHRIGQYGGGVLADTSGNPIDYRQPAARGLEPSKLHMFIRAFDGRMTLTKTEAVSILTEMLEYYYMPGNRATVERKAAEEVTRLMKDVHGDNLILVPLTDENIPRLNAARERTA